MTDEIKGPVSFSLTPTQRKQAMALGGSKWLQAAIERDYAKIQRANTEKRPRRRPNFGIAIAQGGRYVVHGPDGPGPILPITDLPKKSRPKATTPKGKKK